MTADNLNGGDPVEIDREVSLEGLPGQQVYPDTIQPMLQAAIGHKVLNVGCAGSDALTNPHPVHARIAEVSQSCLGLDIYQPGVRKLQADGFDVIYANAEDFELPDKDFEVAVLGDVIEHVSNPGLVFDCVYRHLRSGGRVVVTTPNPFSFTLMLKRTLGYPYRQNSEHVFWFDPVLLSWLMERSGFILDEVFWIGTSRYWLVRRLQAKRKNLHPIFGLVARKP